MSLKIIKLILLQIAFICTITFADSLEDSDGCWIDCNIQISYDSLLIVNDTIYAIFQIKNMTNDTFLLCDDIETGYNFSEPIDRINGLMHGGGGGSESLTTDKCKHWSGKHSKEFKSIIDNYKWKKLEPFGKIQIQTEICKYDENKIITNLSITKSFIYRYNSLLNNYHVCNRDKVEFEIER
jgi:hypothetical protein